MMLTRTIPLWIAILGGFLMLVSAFLKPVEGLGEDFANALHDRFPGPDFDDLMALVDLAAARPDATVVRLDGVGHYPMSEAPERFLAALGIGIGLIVGAATSTPKFKSTIQRTSV